MRECQTCKSCYADNVMNCPKDGTQTFYSIAGEPVLEGKYQLEKRLGQGGMGVVYKALHKYLKTSHAIKVILPDLVGNDPQLVTRFRQEALAAAAIRHQNVVAVTDYGVVEGKIPFLVMEYVEGESLHDLLVREKRLSPQNALALMSAICAGVGAAHRQGIVHRDLKPLNIMIQKGRPISEAVKILDFGLAKIKSGELLGSFIQAQTTGLMGSPYYMAPEQWADEDPDAGSDVYSLGVILFQILAGDVPFKGSSIPAIMKKHLSDSPPNFAELGISVTPQVEKAVRHTLEKERKERTKSVENLVEELREAVASNPTITPSTTGTIVKNQTVTSLQVFTKPSQANVFIDNIEVGKTHDNGWLMLEGITSGNHQIRVSREGFYDSQRNISCDGKPQQVTIELKSIGETQPPIEQTQQFNQTANTPHNLTANTQNALNQTASPSYGQSIINQEQTKKSAFSPVVLAVIGILGLLLLSGIGIVSAYMLGLFGGNGKTTVSNVANNQNNNAKTDETPKVEITTKNEMVKITGGKFRMGNNNGQPPEMPEHEVEIKNFYMDKTEVTNAEYAKFIEETEHQPPAHWSGKKPVAGEEMLPVVRVSIDDVKKFAEWRSKRDNKTYRLPTEEEWEYAARNGDSKNLYPWGDKWEDGRAVFEESAPKPVGSNPKGKNAWEVEDLIGNVWEWTNSELKAYPGSKFELKKGKNAEFVIRGGGFVSKSTGEKAVNAATRLWVESSRKDAFLGFRLVRTEQ